MKKVKYCKYGSTHFPSKLLEQEFIDKNLVKIILDTFITYIVIF